MRVQVKRAFQSHLFVIKKTVKSRKTLHEIFFNLQFKCAEVPIFPISKSAPFILKIFQPSGKDQQIGKQTFFRLPH